MINLLVLAVTLNGHLLTTDGEFRQLIDALEPLSVQAARQTDRTAENAGDPTSGVQPMPLPGPAHIRLGIPENTVPGALVANVVELDDRFLGTTGFRIVSGDPDQMFVIDEVSGDVLVNDSAVLNAESNQHFTLVVSAQAGVDSLSSLERSFIGHLRDSGFEPDEVNREFGLTPEATVEIAIHDVNEPPRFVDKAPRFTTSEDSQHEAVIGQVAAVDPDRDDRIRYSRADDSPSTAFDVNPTTGEVFVADVPAIDFESGARHALSIVATDRIGRSARIDVIVDISNVTEPPVLADCTVETPEGPEAGMAFFRLSADDPDFDDSLVYDIADGPSSSLFAVDPVGGELWLRDPLPEADTRKTAITHDLVIRVADSSGLTDSANVRITIPPSTAPAPPTVVQTARDTEPVEDESFQESAESALPAPVVEPLPGPESFVNVAQEQDSTAKNGFSTAGYVLFAGVAVVLLAFRLRLFRRVRRTNARLSDEVVTLRDSVDERDRMISELRTRIEILYGYCVSDENNDVGESGCPTDVAVDASSPAVPHHATTLSPSPDLAASEQPVQPDGGVESLVGPTATAVATAPPRPRTEQTTGWSETAVTADSAMQSRIKTFRDIAKQSASDSLATHSKKVRAARLQKALLIAAAVSMIWLVVRTIQVWA